MEIDDRHALVPAAVKATLLPGLKPYGIKVSELTGDRQLQIVETQIIVNTSEKWNVITRKATES